MQRHSGILLFQIRTFIGPDPARNVKKKSGIVMATGYVEQSCYLMRLAHIAAYFKHKSRRKVWRSDIHAMS